MNKIKVLRIIARLNIGGPAIHVILLSEGLNKDQFVSLLVSGSVSPNEGDMSYLLKGKNISLSFIPELSRELNLLNDAIALWKIFKIIRKEKPDIIHTHTAKAGTLGRLAGILFNSLVLNPKEKIKLVHTFHGNVLSGYFGRLKTSLFLGIERIFALFTNKIITVSESNKKELISLMICKEDKIEVIKLGFELDKFLEIKPKEDKFLKVGIVGRLVPVKNHKLFIYAAAILLKSYPGNNLAFDVVGDGELSLELKNLALDLKISEKLNFHGWRKDLNNVYSDLDIVALTSINEGTPVSLIEAMASGRAVVATDVGGVRDLLGNRINIEIVPDANFEILERGIIVKPQDVASFAKALILLLQNAQLRKDLGRRARHFAENEFTKERLVNNIENLYNQLICK
ncbi:MAG: glycosyltransferase family 4 protein [Candidatus Omnitrophica bacterium]|nr:glycosyltransferase family 4 protein [Candidatus Omnitrophota bacterium]